MPTRHAGRLKWLVLFAFLVIGATLATLGASSSSGTLIHAADFETGDFSQWSEVQAFSRRRYRVVREPRRQGAFAARFESVAGECIGGDCTGGIPRGRTEALLAGAEHPVREGEDVWYRWYALFPRTGPMPRFTFTQWRADGERQTARAPSGIFGLLTVDRSASAPRGFLDFERNGDRWTGPLHRGRWIKFLVHIRFSSDRAVGTYELWVDGRHAVSFHDQSKAPGAGVYLKQGVYRNGDTPSGVVYLDGLRVASTRDAADPDWVDRLLGRDGG
jgi:Polysaccharide lyase